MHTGPKGSSFSSLLSHHHCLVVWIWLPIQNEQNPFKKHSWVSLLWVCIHLDEWTANPCKLSLRLIKMQWNCNIANHHCCSSHFFSFCTEDRIKRRWERGKKPNLWLFKVLTFSTATCRVSVLLRMIYITTSKRGDEKEEGRKEWKKNIRSKNLACNWVIWSGNQVLQNLKLLIFIVHASGEKKHIKILKIIPQSICLAHSCILSVAG